MKARAAAVRTFAIVALAAASTLTVVLTRRYATTEETEAREKNLLASFREDDLVRVTLQGAKPFALARSAGGSEEWRFSRPRGESANQEAVERLIAALNFATPLRPAPEGREVLGISDASPRIELEFGSVSYVLRLGKAVPTPAGASYVEVSARGAPRGGAFVVPRDVAALFATDPDSLRQHGLVPYTESAIARLSLDSPGRSLTLARGAGAVWQLPSGQRADRGALSPIFAALSGLELRHFLDRASAEAAQAAAEQTRVRVVPKSGEPVEIVIGGRCPSTPELAVAVEQGGEARAGCVDPSPIERSWSAPDQLVDRHPFVARPDEVEELAIERDGKSLVLTRKGTSFLLRQPSEASVPLDAGNARVEAVVRAPAELVPAPDRRALGLDPPRGRVRVLTPVEGKPVEEIVTLGRSDPDGTLYVARNDGVVLSLAREAARAFQVEGLLLRSPSLLEFAQSELESVTLEGAERQVMKRSASGSFELVEPRGFDIDAGLASDLAFTLGSLTAVRWLAESDDGSFGFRRPALRATLTFQAGDAGAKRRVLEIGSRRSGGYAARFLDDPAIFLLEPAVVEALEALLIDRAAFAVDPKTVERIELERAGKRALVVERGGQYQAVAPPELTEAQAHELIGALDALRADVALHTGPARAEEGLARPELRVRVARRGLPPLAFALGASDSYRGLAVTYARIEGIDATFAIARSKLRPLFDLF